MTGEIAVGVPVYSRSGALSQFLDSLPSYVSRAIVADNGPPGEHAHVYCQDWGVNIDVLELDHDIGIGACRAAITDAVDEPYLWMGDCDMEFCRDQDLQLLRRILAAHDDLGGVSGWLIEGDVVRSAARDLVFCGDTMIKQGQTPAMGGEPYPHARFEFIPQAGLFRTEIYETYDYDPRLRTYEHGDFFIGQERAGKWAFASTPVVQVQHHKDIDPEYRATRGRHDADTDWLKQKWGVSQTVPGAASDWAQLFDRSIAEEAFGVFRKATPPRVWLPARRALKRVVG